MFPSLAWLQGMNERVGCSPEEETGADCILLETPLVLEGQEEGLQLGSPAGRWALESLWMKVHGWHGQNVWQMCNRLRVAQGTLAISLSSIERDVSRLEGGDGDTGNIGWFKANWWHHFGALQRSLSGQVPLPSSRNSLGKQGCPWTTEQSKPTPAWGLQWTCSELRATAGNVCLASLIICSKNNKWSQDLHAIFPWDPRKELPTGKGCSDDCGATKLLVWMIRA